jgi:hypothetical protein
MKTAMQELKIMLENLWANSDVVTIESIIDFMNDYGIEKEKEQIKDAWDAGMSEGIGTTMGDLDWNGEFINYYNETYTK